MQALYIILPILLFLFLLLLASIRFTLSYDGSLRLTVSYLFLTFTLHPRKSKLQKKKKRKKKKSKARSMPPSHTTEKKEKLPLRFSDIRFLLRTLTNVAGAILEKASHHVRIRIKRLHITIGGEEDAARAAIEYGILSQAVTYLIAYLRETRFLAPPRSEAVAVRAAFTERGYSLSARLTVSCPILFLIPLALSALTKALTAKGSWTRYRANQRKQAKATELKKENDHG